MSIMLSSCRCGNGFADQRLLQSRGWVWLCRCLTWFIAIGFLASETREVFQLQQLTQLTQFALFFLLANYQLSIARYHLAGRDDVMASSSSPAVFRCSSRRFLRCLMLHSMS